MVRWQPVSYAATPLMRGSGARRGSERVTFGQTIADARKRAGLSQKGLAARIKKDDGQSISAQYLHDLERDRHAFKEAMHEDLFLVLRLHLGRTEHMTHTLP
jgi:ribosome-binding protein aMBF1 (putative translation factor)